MDRSDLLSSIFKVMEREENSKRATKASTLEQGYYINTTIPTLNSEDLIDPLLQEEQKTDRLATNTFKRPELPPGRNIRLLQIWPNAATSSLRCNFVVKSLDEPDLDFQAISYCWGKDLPSEKLWFSSTEFIQVTKSLFSILKLLAKEAKGSYYWIDALCIDQDDSPEKVHQIRLMRDIFASAGQVMAFIGDATPDSDHGMQFISRLKDSIGTASLLEHAGLVTEVDTSVLSVNEPGRYSSESWGAFQKILARPWFQRSWCVQEIVVAKKATLRCGDQTADWHDLAYAMARLARTGMAHLTTVDDDGRLEVGGYMNLVGTFALRGLEETRYAPLQICLLFGNEFQATLPHDKIFAMLGIATDTADDALLPDYSISAQALFTKVTGHLFNRDHSMQLLQLAGIGWPRNFHDLPSWVPDFTARRKSSVLGPNDDSHTENQPATSMHVDAEAQLHSQWTFIDQVTEHASCMPEWIRSSDREASRQSRLELLKWFKQTLEWSKAKKWFPGRKARQIAYWRTLLCDMRFKTGFATKAPSYEDYPSLFKTMLLALEMSTAPKISPELEDELVVQLLSNSEALIRIVMESRDRRLFRTHKGYLGLGPALLQRNDWVCIGEGAITPFLLRSRGATSQLPNETYFLVGECYVDGLMRGESRNLTSSKRITIV